MLIAAIAGTIGGARVSITDQGVSDVQPSPGTAFAGYRLTSSGEAQTDTNSSSWTRVEDWIRPTSAAPGSYEVRATLNSGTLTSGTTGSWLALSTTPEWTVERTLNGISSASLTIEIRRGTTVLDSATVTLTAERTL